MKNKFQKNVKVLSSLGLLGLGFVLGLFNISSVSANVQQLELELNTEEMTSAATRNSAIQFLGQGYDEPLPYFLNLRLSNSSSWTDKAIRVSLLKCNDTTDPCTTSSVTVWSTGGISGNFVRIPNGTANEFQTIGIPFINDGFTDTNFIVDRNYQMQISLTGCTSFVDDICQGANGNPNGFYFKGTTDLFNGIDGFQWSTQGDDASVDNLFFVLHTTNSDNSGGSISIPTEGQTFTSQTSAQSWSGICTGTDKIFIYIRNNLNGQQWNSGQFDCPISGQWSRQLLLTMGNSVDWYGALVDENFRLLDEVNFIVDIENNDAPDDEFLGGVIITPTDPEDENSPFFVDCTDYDGVNFFNDGVFAGIFCYTKKAIYFSAGILFQPNPNTTMGLQNTLSSFQDVFPFSVPFSVINALKTTIDDGVTGTNLTFTFPALNNYTFTFLSANLIGDVAGNDFRDMVFGTIMGIVWTCVFFIIYKQIRKKT